MNEIEDEYGQLQCELTRIRIEKEKIDIKIAECALKVNEQTLKSAKCIYETKHMELKRSEKKLEELKNDIK